MTISASIIVFVAFAACTLPELARSQMSPKSPKSRSPTSSPTSAPTPIINADLAAAVNNFDEPFSGDKAALRWARMEQAGWSLSTDRTGNEDSFAVTGFTPAETSSYAGFMYDGVLNSCTDADKAGPFNFYGRNLVYTGQGGFLNLVPQFESFPNTVTLSATLGQGCFGAIVIEQCVPSADEEAFSVSISRCGEDIQLASVDTGDGAVQVSFSFLEGDVLKIVDSTPGVVIQIRSLTFSPCSPVEECSLAPTPEPLSPGKSGKSGKSGERKRV